MTLICNTWMGQLSAPYPSDKLVNMWPEAKAAKAAARKAEQAKVVLAAAELADRVAAEALRERVDRERLGEVLDRAGIDREMVGIAFEITHEETPGILRYRGVGKLTILKAIAEGHPYSELTTMCESWGPDNRTQFLAMLKADTQWLDAKHAEYIRRIKENTCSTPTT